MKLPTGIVVFLFTDIVDSTSHWKRHDAAMNEVQKRHDTIMRQVIENAKGEVFKTVGDAFHAVFSNPSDAITAAISAQRALSREDWSPLNTLQVRMALHCGRARKRGDDYFGLPLSRVARIRDITHGGQILVSEAFYYLAKDVSFANISFKCLGEFILRNLEHSELIYQLEHPDLPHEFPPIPSRRVTPNNLPIQLTPFIGRKQEVAEVRQLVSKKRFVTLIGLGGCGKTRLALKVAAGLLKSSGGVWLISLGDIHDPELILPSLAKTLSVMEQKNESLMQAITGHIRDQQLVLILDNCEHLREDCAQITGTLLAMCSRLRILVTSREELGVRGEVVWSVPPLSLPKPNQALSAQTVKDSDAVQLFASYAEPNFDLMANLATVVDICNLLEGIPYLIELVAPQTKWRSLSDIIQKLPDRLTISSRDPNLPERQRTMRSIQEWSYKLLVEKEQLLLCRSSIFSGGWTLNAIEAICADEEIPLQNLANLMVRLSQKSLVIYDKPQVRYRLHEVTRQYCSQLLHQNPIEEVRQKNSHKAFFTDLAMKAEAELEGADQAKWLTQLEAEHNNLRAALDWCELAEERALDGLRLATSIWRFWWIHGHVIEGRKRLERLLATTTTQQNQFQYEEVRAKALNILAVLNYHQSDYKEAERRHEESLEIAQRLGLHRRVAINLNGLGNIAKNRRDYPQARSYFSKSLAKWRELENTPSGDGALSHIAATLNNLGLVAYESGEFDKALSFISESQNIYKQQNNLWGIAETSSNLGDVFYQQGNYANAESNYNVCEAISRQLGSKRGIALAKFGIARIVATQKNFEKAWSLFKESLQLFYEGRYKWQLADVLHGMGNLMAQSGKHLLAATIWGGAEALRETLRTSLIPWKQAEHQKRIEKIRSRLQAEKLVEFDVSWDSGKRMTMEQVVEFAMSVRLLPIKRKKR